MLKPQIYNLHLQSHIFLKKYRFVLFIILFSVISIYYGQEKILVKKPQGLHRWRQADCASFALNYYQEGMKFFHPTLHNLISDNFTTGCGVSEAPILYYIVALLYKFFGPHDFIFRIINFIIFFIGLFFLFKISFHYLQNTFYSILIPLLLYTSPIATYYSSCYLTDITAMSLVFIGWYHFLQYYRKNISYFMIISFVIIGIAVLLKITTIINLFAVSLILISNRIGLIKDVKKIILSKSVLLSFLIVCSIMLGYYYWVLYYNKEHLTGYFSNRIFPVWTLDHGKINQICLVLVLVDTF